MKHGEKSQKALDDEAKAAKKTADEVSKFRDQWNDTLQDFKSDELQKNLQKSIDTLDRASFDNLKTQYSKSIEESFMKAQENAIKAGVPEAEVRAQAQKMAEVQTTEWAQKFEDKSTEAYENSIETWRGLFENAITGATFDLESALKQVAVGFAAQMAQAVFGSIGGLDISKPADIGGFLAKKIFGEATGNLFDIGSLFGGGGVSGIGPVASGDAYGSMLGGGGAGMFGGSLMSAVPFVAAAAGAVLAGKAGMNIFKGKEDNSASGMAGRGQLAILTGGLSEVVKAFGGFGGKKNAGTMARNEVRDWLETNLKGKNFSVVGADGKSKPFGGFDFNGSQFRDKGWGEKFNNSKDAGAFGAIGEGLKQMLGITEDVGGQIGAILSQNMGENLGNLNSMLQALGITQEQMTEQFVKAGEAGSMSWHQVEVALQGVDKAFSASKVAVADFAGGFDQIIGSAGDGMDAIDSIKNAAVAAGQAGQKSFEQWKSALLAAGKDPEMVNAMFQAFSQRGIKTFEEIKNASTRQIGGVVADMESISPALSQMWTKAQEEAQKYLQTVSQIPEDSTKNVTLNVDANLSPAAQKVLDMQGGNVSIPSDDDIPKLAKGGIVTRATKALIGEAGAEIVMPLTQYERSLKNAAQTNGLSKSKNNVLVINAPNAQQGVDEDVRRMIHEMGEMTIDRVMNTINEMANRY